MSEKHVERGKEKGGDAAIERREFLRKGASVVGLLPYVAPVITTFLLDVNETGGQEVAPQGAKAKAARQTRALSPVLRAREAQQAQAAQVRAARAKAAAVKKPKPVSPAAPTT